MNNDNAKPRTNSSRVPETAVADFSNSNQNHDAVVRSRHISDKILNPLAEWRSADQTARRPKIAAATRPLALHAVGSFYAPATPRDLAVAFDATHVARSDQIDLRRYEGKQDRNENPLDSGVKRRVTRCPLRTNAL
ncbi:hypothetical protein ACIPEP_15440 [Curtobacterium sp. NPDC087082]|uniref:hypothetical protein n=1 Tax=Curtobacterium sp. NPDC087082 TaxID=3363966 RepID=UPI0038256B72